MAPGRLLWILGLCNGVAGALFMLAPAQIAPLQGLDSPSASLAARSAGALLIAVAIGAWRMPPLAARPYLWIFGVGVKAAAAAIWARMALSTGVGRLWLGVAVDVAVAVVVTVGLLRRP